MQHSWSLRCLTRLIGKEGKMPGVSTARHVGTSQCTRPCSVICGFLIPAA